MSADSRERLGRKCVRGRGRGAGWAERGMEEVQETRRKRLGNNCEAVIKSKWRMFDFKHSNIHVKFNITRN